MVYAGSSNWSTQDSTTVPPEWHSWLHYIGDYNPTNHEFKQPIFAGEACAHPSVPGPLGHVSTQPKYAPKGSWSNPQKLSWRKYEAWQPPQEA